MGPEKLGKEKDSRGNMWTSLIRRNKMNFTGGLRASEDWSWKDEVWSWRERGRKWKERHREFRSIRVVLNKKESMNGGGRNAGHWKGKKWREARKKWCNYILNIFCKLFTLRRYNTIQTNKPKLPGPHTKISRAI